MSMAGTAPTHFQFNPRRAAVPLQRVTMTLFVGGHRSATEWGTIAHRSSGHFESFQRFALADAAYGNKLGHQWLAGSCLARLPVVNAQTRDADQLAIGFRGQAELRAV